MDARCRDRGAEGAAARRLCFAAAANIDAEALLAPRPMFADVLSLPGSWASADWDAVLALFEVSRDDNAEVPVNASALEADDGNTGIAEDLLAFFSHESFCLSGITSQDILTLLTICSGVRLSRFSDAKIMAVYSSENMRKPGVFAVWSGGRGAVGGGFGVWFRLFGR